MSHYNRAARRKQRATANSSEPPPTTPREPMIGSKWRVLIQRLLDVLWHKGTKFMGTFLTVVGAIALFFDFSPNISVSPTDSTQPSDPFSTLFIISVAGNMPINDVFASCALDATFGTVRLENVGFENSKLDIAKEIQPGEGMTFPCRYRDMPLAASPLTSGDLYIVISYRQSYWPFKSIRSFRFQGQKAFDDSWRWVPQPLTK